MILKEGYRQFLYPEPINGERKSHNWSFLYPLGTITTGTWPTTEYVNGTLAVSFDTVPESIDDNYQTYIEQAAGRDIVFPRDVVGEILTWEDGLGLEHETTIHTRVDDTTLEGWTSSTTAATASEWSLSRTYHDLPSDFGGMVSDGFTYRGDATTYSDIKIIGEGEIRRTDRENSGLTHPAYASITPVAPLAKEDGEGGDSGRWVVRFLPPAGSTTHNLEFRYYAIPPALDSDTNFYPYGGAEHSSTIIASVVDQAFQKIHSSYEKHDAFIARLRQSVMHDRRNYAASYVGKGVGSYGAGGHNDLEHFRRNTSTDNITLGF